MSGLDTSPLAKKHNLANLKSEIDRLDIEKLNSVPSGLSSLKDKIAKSNVHKLVHVSADLFKLSNIVKINVVKKDVYNAKIKDIKNKNPIISSVTITAALTNIKIIPEVSGFVKKQIIIQKWEKKY